MTHLDINTLAEYVLQPEQLGQEDVLDHLASCPACRSRLARVAQVQQQVQAGITEKQDSVLAEEEVPAYADHTMPEAERVLFSERLKQDKAALKASLHYAASSLRMQTEMNTAAVTAHSHKPASGGHVAQSGQTMRPAWLEWLFRPTPAWTALSATAAVMLVVAMLMRPDVTMIPANRGIAVFQDESVMSFQSNTPGIGFFSSAGGRTQAYAGIDIKLVTNGDLHVQWPAVANAQEYEVTLQRVLGEQLETLFQGSTTDTGITVNRPALIEGKLYQWTLSGTTVTQERFQAQGGFVLNAGN